MTQNIDFKEFIETSQKTWKNKIREEIKLSSEKNLYWEPIKGIKLAPFYSDYNFEYISTRTGNFSSNTLHWKTREKFPLFEGKKSDTFLKKIKEGVDAFEIDLSYLKMEQWEDLINQLPPHVTLHFIPDSPAWSSETILFLDKLYHSKKFKGSFLYQPWTEDTYDFTLPANLTALLPLLQKHSGENIPLLYIKSANLYRKELSVVGQLALALAKVVECADVLTEQGIPVLHCLQIMEIEFPIGKSYFLEIAKLRAWRLLWSSLKANYGVQDHYYPPIHSVTSISETEDKNLNIVKYTTQAMSAIIGGCDYLTILPFDPEHKDQEFSSRISRNISLLLKEEANMASQKDPAAGSFYIENITNVLYKKAWELFLDIEQHGGLGQVIKNKSVNID